MAYLDQFLHHGMGRRASDIHFSSGEPVKLRIDGDLVNMDENPLSSEQIQQLFMEILNEEEKEKFEKQKQLDKSYAVPDLANFRLNLFWTRRGLSAVIRSIPSKIPTMADLGLPDAIRTLTELAKGLVLVTGPTGSGKSTTLAAMINEINMNHPYHILTAEDPVEFVHPSKMCLVNQREMGTNCHSFADALKAALREDPDIILVGEMRDLETIGLALTAAETGHLVFGTLHTRGAAASVDRIIDSFPANQQAMVRAMLSESLKGVISQALLKKKGAPGRVAAYEIMITNHAISNLIREGKTFQIPSIIQTGRREGMILMEQHLKDLIANGTIDEEEAAPYLEGDHKPKQAGPAKPAPTPKPMPTPSMTKPGSGPFQPKLLDTSAAPKKPEPVSAKPPPVGAAPPKPGVTPGAPPKATISAAPRPGAPGATPPPVGGVRPPPMGKPATAVPPPPAGTPPKPGAPNAFAPLKADPAKALKPTPPPAPGRAPAPAPVASNDEMPIETDLNAYAIEGTGSIDLNAPDGVLEVKLPDDDGLLEVSETTGTHDVGQQRGLTPPSAPGTKPMPVPPFKKTG